MATTPSTSRRTNDADTTPAGRRRAADKSSSTPPTMKLRSEPESALHALTFLEGDSNGRTAKGVQRRDFMKRHRFELFGRGRLLRLGRPVLDRMPTAALRLLPGRAAADFGPEARHALRPVHFRLEEPYDKFRRAPLRVEHGVQGIFSMLCRPSTPSSSSTDTTIIHGDVFAVAGAGPHHPLVRARPHVGGGAGSSLPRDVPRLPLDVRDFLIRRRVLGRDRITNNVHRREASPVAAVNRAVPAGPVLGVRFLGRPSARRGAGRACLRTTPAAGVRNPLRVSDDKAPAEPSQGFRRQKKKKDACIDENIKSDLSRAAHAHTREPLFQQTNRHGSRCRRLLRPRPLRRTYVYARRTPTT